ncbi:MAG: ABC transporter substrate-binding protein [Lachnospiraceae bacterium]|nr:ABC transporter substrate-binding protein [Lachnospiraceae bacterium]MCD7765052.1 ABC transporter substrate-binding protein [Lachnospiraceae bacterium]
MNKRKTSMALAASMILSLTTGALPVLADDTVSITIFNSKSEIQSQLEEKAAEYSAETGVEIEVYYSSDTVSAHLATRYASGDPYTISMVDAKDVYSLAEEYAVDLSDEDWVNDTEYEIAIDGVVYGFPVCVEARGIIYNADAIEAITGETFDPSAYTTLDAFTELLETLVAGGMETPVGIMKEDWSLGAHYLSEVYEQQEDVEAFISALQEGTADLINNEKFNSLMDVFDVLMQYNYAAGSAIAAEREVTEMMLADGEIAFMFGGNWDWSVINAYDYTENMGIMAVPQNTDDGTNEKLVGGGSKFFFIDSSENTSEEQVQAAKDFLNWLVYDEDGQSFLVNDCALVPAYSNITLDVSDPLGQSVKEYADAGLLIDNYNYLPDDHYSLLGAAFQKYLAGQIDREGFAAEIESYWLTAEVAEH